MVRRRLVWLGILALSSWLGSEAFNGWEGAVRGGRRWWASIRGGRDWAMRRVGAARAAWGAPPRSIRWRTAHRFVSTCLPVLKRGRLGLTASLAGPLGRKSQVRNSIHSAFVHRYFKTTLRRGTNEKLGLQEVR